MSTSFNLLAHLHAGLFAIAALAVLVLALCWALNRAWRERRLADMRARLAEMTSSDPGYNQVRALYTDMVIRSHGASNGTKDLQSDAGNGHGTHDNSSSGAGAD